MNIQVIDQLLGSMPADWLPNELTPALNDTGAWLESQYPLLTGFDHIWRVDSSKFWTVLYNRSPVDSRAGVGAAASFTASPPEHLNVAPSAKVYGLSVIEIQQGLLAQSCGAVLQHRTASFETSGTVLARWLEEFHPDVWQSLQLPPPPTEMPTLPSSHPSELPPLRYQPCGCHPCRRPLPHKVKRATRQPSHQAS